MIHFQIVTLLQDPQDSWTKAMAKIAEDAVHRMFDHLSRLEGSKKLDKELLLECLVEGKSSSKFSAEIKNKKRYPGRQIYVKQSKDAFLTSELFEKPLVVWQKFNENFILPCTENVDEEKYFHRHSIY